MSQVNLSVPLLMHEQDSELEAMGALQYVMAHFSEVLTDDEFARVVVWFSSRYGAKQSGGEG